MVAPGGLQMRREDGHPTQACSAGVTSAERGNGR